MKLLVRIGAAVLIFCNLALAQNQLIVTNLKCESRVNPPGVDTEMPRLSWIMESLDRSFIQGSYQIFVASSRENLNSGNADLWDSSRIKSSQSVNIPYNGKRIESGMQCWWKVQVWDKNGKVYAMSEPAYWAMGLLNASDWKGKWIGLDGPPPQDEFTKLSARMLRREFENSKCIKRATAYVCGLGMFELYLNGEKVSNHIEDPAWTLYSKRSLYLTFDVTEKIKAGKNAIGVILGNGRYYPPRKSVPFSSNLYFGHPKLLIQLEIENTDGTKNTILSDSSWKLTTEGPIRSNNEYDGEEYDAQMEMPGWADAGFDDSKWQVAQEVNSPGGLISSQTIEPMVITETLKPVKISVPEPNVYIYDLGQNITGWARLRVNGPAGAKVSMRFAESLTDKGMLYTENLRGAKVTDTYILKGQGTEIWEPRFIAHGFQYIELTGFPGEPNLETIHGIVSHTDMEIAGEFSCSNPLINNIYKNFVWTVRANYRGIPTDCPQRAEREGWLGDPAERSKGESYAFTVTNFYSKWLTDIQDSQKPDGTLPNLVPPFYEPPKGLTTPPPGFVTVPSSYSTNVTWPSVYIMIPNWFYEQYGDKRIVEKHYPSMKKWMQLLKGYVKNDTIALDKFGDWCVPPESPELVHSKDPNRKTDGELMATTHYYRNLNLMAKYAQILDKKDDAKEYRREAEKIKKAFNNKFLNKENGVYSNGTQTSCVLPLYFDMVPEKYQDKVFASLVNNIMVKCSGHIGTGIIGNQYLMRTLADNGRPDVAYTLASQTTYPSWGYMLSRGATTLWELWNGDTANPSMNSRSHLMLVGDLVIWLYEDLAGIQSDPETPGYEKIIIKPVITKDLNYAKGMYKSVRGLIVSEWKIQGDKLFMNVIIPANCTASIYVPATDEKFVTENGIRAKKAIGLDFWKKEGKYVVYKAGSGSYAFEAKYTPASEK